MSRRSYFPLLELFLLRTKEFFREPQAIFWVYVFPIILMIGLGIAFQGGGAGQVQRIDVIEGARADEVVRALEPMKNLHARKAALDDARARHAGGETDLIVEPLEGGFRFIYDPSREGSETAKLRVNEALQAAAGRKDPLVQEDVQITEPGSRYIDWLIPGLLGMNIMGGGLWGLGFVTVDLRMRKLLKRFVATPMRRSDFLIALLGSRLVFLIPEIVIILTVGRLLFGLEIRGSLLAVAGVSLVGTLCFGGLGLLLGSRADRIETIDGLLNLVMLPMWLFSGVFFSSDRFPEAMQPFIQALPLTQLIASLRAVILQGASLGEQWLPAAFLCAIGALAFAGALRWFRWL